MIFASFWYEKKKGEEMNSPALKADALHLQADSLSAFIVWLSLIAAQQGYLFVEKIATVIVVLFLLRAGGSIIRDALKGLLDASIDFSALEKIREIISAHPRVVKIKDLRARSVGSVIFLTAEVILRCPGFKEAHAITEELERAIKEAVLQIERVTIHYEPEEREYLLVVAPLEDLKGTLSDHFGGAPYLAFLKNREGKGRDIRKEHRCQPLSPRREGQGDEAGQAAVVDNGG